MKNIFILMFLLLISRQAMSQSKDSTVSFKVYGNCEMCQETIETAVDVKGVKNASWNMQSKMLTLSFNPAKITLQKIHALIAASGYDTEETRADSNVYKNLAPCCQYIRRSP